MIPASGLAFLVVLALVPGWAFLRLTEGLRKPFQRGPLWELLEVVAVGLLTTGVAAVALTVAFPAVLRRALDDPLATNARLTSTVLLLSGCLLGASVLAVLAALAWTCQRPERYRPSVWEGVLGQKRDGKIRHVTIELSDGRKVDGQLAGYTWSESESGQQIALGDKVWVKEKNEPRTLTKFDYFVVDGSQIAFFTMTYTEDK